MGYTFAVSLLFALAAYGLDRAGLYRKGCRRWIWAAAMSLSLAYPAAMLLRPPLAAANQTSAPLLPEILERADTLRAPSRVLVTATPAARANRPTSRSFPVERRQWHPADAVNPSLAILWLVSASALALWLSIGRLLLSRRAMFWVEECVDGHRVRVSEDDGPVVVGFLRPFIVLPRWLLRAPLETRTMVLRHEAQHLAAGDPKLVLIGLVFLVLTPWNLPLWWQLSRLRFALEVDCDARVRRDGADVTAYARMLLAVCEQKSHIPVGGLAMSARRSELESRFAALLVTAPRSRSVIAAAIAASMVVVASATQLPAPEIRTPPVAGAADSRAPASAELKDALGAFDRGDYLTALEKLRPLAEEGNAEAENRLGQMYDRGLGVTQAYVQAAAWYRKAAAQGDIGSQAALSGMYSLGRGVPRNYDAAALWGRQTMLQVLENPCDPRWNFEFHPPGKETIQDEMEAFRKAAEFGDAEAAVELGSIYETGFPGGVRNADHAAALKWIRLAAEYDNAQGEAALASLYLSGSAVPPDAKAAVASMRRAADQGLLRAQCSLAVMYDKGIGAQQDRAEAAKWYRVVADNADRRKGVVPNYGIIRDFTLTRLGHLYEAGYGVSRNESDALTWLRRAADHGYPAAETSLGLVYVNGNGATRDYAKALTLLTSAAWKGETAAQIALANLYAKGRGVRRDPVRAYTWLGIAARYASSNAEYSKALQDLAGIYSRLTQQQVEQANGLVRAWQPVDDLGDGVRARGLSRVPTYP